MFARWILAAIGTLLAVVSHLKVTEATESTSWPSVRGLIVASKVVREYTAGGSSASGGRQGASRSSSSGRDFFSPRVEFSYRVDGKEHRANRISLGGDFYSKRSSAQAIADRYPVGREVAVFYSPRQPSSGVLVPGVADRTWVVLRGLGLILVAISLIAMLLSFGLRRHLRRQEERWKQGSGPSTKASRSSSLRGE